MDKPTPPNYYAMALDPVHVGTGGYRLGRVDLTIVREPGTHLPKIPGTSLSGPCRAYAAMKLGRYQWVEKCTNPPNGQEIEFYGSCAGQGQDSPERRRLGHCGKYTCPVCITFGFAKKDRGFQGLAQFSDAHILFFPVHSLLGPVWVTCPAVLQLAGLWNSSQHEPVEGEIMLCPNLTLSGTRLNLGWLMLEVKQRNGIPERFELTETLPQGLTTILHRSVLISNSLFDRVVNDNLEVRTSVSVDPRTGAAEEGALFTYEAIPRSTIFWFTVIYSNPDFFSLPVEEEKEGKKVSVLKRPEPRENADPKGRALSLQAVVGHGLTQFQHLGIGGMNTRGMGRLKVFLPNSAKEESSDESSR